MFYHCEWRREARKRRRTVTFKNLGGNQWNHMILIFHVNNNVKNTSHGGVRRPHISYTRQNIFNPALAARLTCWTWTPTLGGGDFTRVLPPKSSELSRSHVGGYQKIESLLCGIHHGGITGRQATTFVDVSRMLHSLEPFIWCGELERTAFRDQDTLLAANWVIPVPCSINVRHQVQQRRSKLTWRNMHMLQEIHPFFHNISFVGNSVVGEMHCADESILDSSGIPRK